MSGKDVLVDCLHDIPMPPLVLVVSRLDQQRSSWHNKQVLQKKKNGLLSWRSDLKLITSTPYISRTDAQLKRKVAVIQDSRFGRTGHL
jgi:hypothetical protein